MTQRSAPSGLIWTSGASAAGRAYARSVTIEQAERVADLSEIRAQAEALRAALVEEGVSDPRVTSDGTLVVHSDAPRLLTLGRITSRLSQIIGHPVRVFFDSTPVVEGWDTAPL